MTQIERDVRCRLIACLRRRFETAQHDLLQPRWHVRIERARRGWTTPQAVEHARSGLGLTERLRAGGKLVEQDTQREKIAAGIAPVVLQLFRRNVGCRASGE